MERSVVVRLVEGLHARPAAQLVATAAAQPVAVTLRAPGREPVPASSILGVLTLGVGAGATVVLSTDSDGHDARAALDALAEVLDPTPAD
ncbi:HPr family phosphocarrier protein [Cellulomonas hominis]